MQFGSFDARGFVLVALLLAAVATTQAQTTPSKLEGEIAGVDHALLRIRSASGQETPVALPEKVRVTQRVPMSLDDLKAGLFLGTTAVPQPDGTLLASEVHVFPENRRGTGEGHYPMRNDPRSTMTNATIKEAKPASTMTNATVDSSNAAPGSRILHLVYKGGEKMVVVPANAPVVLSKDSDRSALKRGEHVVAYVIPGPDGGYIADRVSVGVNGSVPPQ